jgi:hypothetical protein
LNCIQRLFLISHGCNNSYSLQWPAIADPWSDSTISQLKSISRICEMAILNEIENSWFSACLKANAIEIRPLQMFAIKIEKKSECDIFHIRSVRRSSMRYSLLQHSEISNGDMKISCKIYCFLFCPENCRAKVIRLWFGQCQQRECIDQELKCFRIINWLWLSSVAARSYGGNQNSFSLVHFLSDSINFWQCPWNMDELPQFREKYIVGRWSLLLDRGSFAWHPIYAMPFRMSATPLLYGHAHHDGPSLVAVICPIPLKAR